MKTEHFQKRVRDLANAEEFNADLFNLIKEKHESLVLTDKDYLKSDEYFYLSELMTTSPDIQLLGYFKNQLLADKVKSWNKS